MRRKLTILLLTLLVFIVSMSLIACKGDEELLATNGQVPVYQGMTISGNNTINNLSPRMAPDENASDVAKYIHGDHTGRDEDIDQETPFEEVPTIDQKTESTLSVVGSGAEIYYANKNQDIYITIKVLNPDSYEIVSFTLNGNKYTSYMFEEGSDLENLILKLNVGEAAGIVDYTIDAIKYIDGTDIKDVIIEGEKTIKAGISADDQTYVNVSNNVTTLNSISFNANLVDLYNLIEKSEGYAKAVLYDGVSIISTKELVAGENSITFDSLVPNKLYQYGIVVLYDNLSGDGIQLNTIYTNAEYTKTIVLFDDISVTQTGITFDYLWEETYENKTITSLSLFLEGEKVEEETLSTALQFSNLLSNVEYEIRASYLNLNQESETISVFFTTAPKATPELTIINPDSTQTSVSFEITETDTDSVGEITKIELIHGTDTPIEASTLDVRTFSDLLSNNLYTVKVTYVYNLNDGLGEQSSIVNLPIWTAPNLTFTQATCANTGPVSKGEIIYFEALVNNPNNVSFTKVKINGQYYNVSSGTSYSEIIVNMTVEDQFEGGNTDLTVTEIVGTLNGVERKMEVNENNTASVFVNGELNVLSIKIIDKNGREPEFVAQGEKYYCLVELANRTGYSIDSIMISGNTYSKYHQYFNSIDNNTLLIDENYFNAGWNSLELSSISYSNESVGEKTKEIVGIVTDSKLCLTNSTPIVISNATDLKNMNGWGYYVLESDIDLIGTTGNEWIDPGSFTGLFDGQGHKIINMKFAGTIENEDLNWGLFFSASGIIRNVIVSGRLLVTITGGSASARGIAVTSSGTLLLNSVGDDVNISINNISQGGMIGEEENSFFRNGNTYYARINGTLHEESTLGAIVSYIEPFWDETIWDFEEIGLPSAKERYDITYNNLEGAQNHLSNLLVYTTRNEEIALLPPTKTGSIFLGWFDNELMSGSAVTDIPIGAYGNLQYYAKWEICNSHTFDDNCTCTKCGYIGHNEGADGYCSVCQSLISISKAIETYGYTRAYEPIWIGEYLKTTVNYVWFGEYPQTIANSEAVVAMGTTPDSNGYYTSSFDNERYAKVVATPYGSGCTVSDSTTVISSSTYYFKVEPIKWRILSESDGKALILCESIIANKRYNEYYSEAIEGVYANNYAESEVRAWLNDQFYNIAFSELQKSLIQTTEVDNSVYSTGYDPNPYTCENTFDKIFLPSYREVTNTAYGFIKNTDRYKVTSDYSRATGAYTGTGDSYSGNGRWWLRSPDYSRYYNARIVYKDGHVVADHSVDIGYYGLVPALTISLD